MGMDLIATALRKHDDDTYRTLIASATPEQVAHCAYVVAHRGPYGNDPTLSDRIHDLIDDEDRAAVDIILGWPDAIAALREHAANGAAWIDKHRNTYGHPRLVDAETLGGPAVWIVGASTYGDDPFPEFRDVALLAAIVQDITEERAS